MLIFSRYTHTDKVLLKRYYTKYITYMTWNKCDQGLHCRLLKYIAQQENACFMRLFYILRDDWQNSEYFSWTKLNFCKRMLKWSWISSFHSCHDCQLVLVLILFVVWRGMECYCRICSADTTHLNRRVTKHLFRYITWSL